MKATREVLLDLLRQHGDMTIAELARKLDIAPPAVRRHLDILATESLVDYRSVKQPTGRPYFVYFRTDIARERESNGYPRLVERLLHEVEALDDGEGAGRRLLETLLERMSDHIAAEHRSQISGNTVEERVASLVTALADEGILEDFEIREDGVHLMNTSCPHRRAALASTALCRSEQRAISTLIELPVEQVSRIVDGGLRCEYIISLAPAKVAAPVCA